MESPKIDPLCPVFGVCGGCAYQDIPYEDELALKGSKLRGLLGEKLGLAGSLFSDPVASPEPYGYRHRLDLTLKRSRGEIQMGFQRPGTNRLVPVDTCAIARPEIREYIPQIRGEATARLPEKYRTANLVIRTGDDGRVLWGGIGRRSLCLEEKDYLWTQINGKKIFYSLETFFQANLHILPLLMKEVEKLAGFTKDSVFFDLYSGVGLFGIYFADRVGKVVMMEEHSGSVKLARYNAACHQYSNVEIFEGLVEASLAEKMAPYEGVRKIAMVDPPRQGLKPGALDTLAQARDLDRLLYLSCLPESLARDLEAFLKAGWKVERVVPLDFFPRTGHLETLACLRP